MIVVTTPTGTIGSQLVQRLLDDNAKVRVIVRDPARLPADVRDRVEVVAGTHGDRDVVATAFDGADAVFWLAPPNPRTETLDSAYREFTRPAAENLTTQRVVAVSATGRGTQLQHRAGLVTASFAMCDLIADTGVPFRELALPGFMDNVLRNIPEIVNEGVYRSPFPGDAKHPTCATKDIAATAARLLLDDTWTGQGRVAVLGPEDLSGNDMAAIMADVLGRPVRHEQVPSDAFLAQAKASGMSDAMVHGFYDMMMAKRDGLDDAEPRTAESTTPTSFRQWCEEVLKPSVDADR